MHTELRTDKPSTKTPKTTIKSIPDRNATSSTNSIAVNNPLKAKNSSTSVISGLQLKISSGLQLKEHQSIPEEVASPLAGK